MSESPDDDFRIAMAAILGDVRTTAVLVRSGDEFGAALLDLVDTACGGGPRPMVVAIGGRPDGGRPVLTAASEEEVPELLRRAGIRRLLTARTEAIPGSEALPPVLRAHLACRARQRLAAIGENDALFERMRKLGYL